MHPININLLANLNLSVGNAAGLPAPVVTVDLSDPADPVLGWAWDISYADPDTWDVYTSIDDGLTWVLESELAGFVRSWHVSPGKLAYIIGIDGSSPPNFITGQSNTVSTTAVSGLTDDDGNALTDDDGKTLTQDD